MLWRKYAQETLLKLKTGVSDDPRGQPLDSVRQIREQIRAKVSELLLEISSTP